MTSSSKTWLGKCWASLCSRLRRTPLQPARPRTITDLCARFLEGEDQSYDAFTRLWGEWLSEFHHSPSMAAVFNPPPVGFPANYSALLAGTAEYLAFRHNLPMPYWVHDRRFYLPLAETFIPLFEECPNLSGKEREVMLTVLKNNTPTQLAKHGVLIRAKSLDKRR